MQGMWVGISTTMIPTNIAMVLLGCFVGSFIGMLPGLGPITAVALMIPVTYGLDPATGMVLLAGLYYGAIFGGSTCSILINAPGEAATVATAFDGYPMAQQGYPGKALAIAAYSSFSGGTIAVVFLMVAAPALAVVAKSFQSSDYFALMIMGLTAVSAFAGKGGMLKSLIMTVIGLMLATIGTDQTSGVQRYTFGSINLLDGISFLMLAMATFALTEAMFLILRREAVSDDLNLKAISKWSSLKVTKKEFKFILPSILRSSVLGFFIGVLPGSGGTLGSFLSYGMERNLAPPEEREKFGKGSLRGWGERPDSGAHPAGRNSALVARIEVKDNVPCHREFELASGSLPVVDDFLGLLLVRDGEQLVARGRQAGQAHERDGGSRAGFFEPVAMIVDDATDPRQALTAEHLVADAERTVGDQDIDDNTLLGSLLRLDHCAYRWNGGLGRQFEHLGLEVDGLDQGWDTGAFGS